MNKTTLGKTVNATLVALCLFACPAGGVSAGEDTSILVKAGADKTEGAKAFNDKGRQKKSSEDPHLTSDEQKQMKTKFELLRGRVKYVFVIFQENRSFDHYFGTYPGANGLFYEQDVPLHKKGDPIPGESGNSTSKMCRSTRRVIQFWM